jgi:uncharacterized paraquat-inducible protein A
MNATRVSYCLLCEGRVSTVYGGYCIRCDRRRRDAERASLSGGIAYLVIAVLFLVAVVLVFGSGL